MPKSKASKNGAEEMHRLQEELRRKDAKKVEYAKKTKPESRDDFVDLLSPQKPTKTGSKRKAAEDLLAPLPKKIKNTDPKPPPRADKPRKKPAPTITWSDVPSTCPTVMCEDKLPEKPNGGILSLFVKRQELIADVGRSGPGIAFLELQICAAITQEKRRDQVAALGQQNKWPQDIDYSTLPGRILKLRKEVLNIIKNETALQELPVWQDFLRNIDYKIFKFSDSPSKMDFTYALYGRRCGYYGPKGEFLINSTLIRLLSADDGDALGNSLFDNIHATILADENLFDPYNETSNLIELKDFIAFILTPFVAALLIAQDMDIPVDQAHDIRDNSNEFGDVMQPDEDGEGGVLDDLHRANIRAMKGTANTFFAHPLRHRKQGVDPPPADAKREINNGKVQSKTGPKSSKGTITLDDFPEPGSKKSTAKNPAAKANKATKKDKTSSRNLALDMAAKLEPMSEPKARAKISRFGMFSENLSLDPICHKKPAIPPDLC
ncbi:hypothetical protein B0H13DRAFT_1875513 [Mycena leptocephala]|nr:hypothetical protein B0H13DRAFT_1875513 [Mycena leptocephala]